MVGGVIELATEAGLPVIVIAGTMRIGGTTTWSPRGASVVTLVEQFGDRRPFDEPRWCIEHAARDALAELARR